MILPILRLAVSLTICFVSLNIPMECRGCLIIIMILRIISLILWLEVSRGHSLDYNDVLPEYNLTNTMACSKLDHLCRCYVLGYNNVLPEYNLTNTMACRELDHLCGGCVLDYNNVLPENNLANTMACSKLDHLCGGCVLGVHLQVAQLERWERDLRVVAHKTWVRLKVETWKKYTHFKTYE